MWNKNENIGKIQSVCEPDSEVAPYILLKRRKKIRIFRVGRYWTSDATERPPTTAGSMGGVPRMISRSPEAILVALEILTCLLTSIGERFDWHATPEAEYQLNLENRRFLMIFSWFLMIFERFWGGFWNSICVKYGSFRCQKAYKCP